MSLTEFCFDTYIRLTIGFLGYHNTHSWPRWRATPVSKIRKKYDPNYKLERYQKNEQERQSQAVAEKSCSEWYEYEPLQPRHIRLLHIPPKETMGTLECKLTVHSIDDHPLFEALSYTWGDRTEVCRLLCDGKSIPITRNLWRALQRVRLPDTTRTFWIDAVCINQDDSSEKGSQVQLMGTIYQEASAVVVWLGDSTQDSSAAIKLMHQIYSVAEDTAAAYWDDAITESDLENHHLPAEDSPDWKALDAIYWRPWFQRVWIIQEITLARYAVVLCGEDSISWAIFVAVANYMIRRNMGRLTGVDPSPVMMLQSAWSQYHCSEEKHLLPLLVTSRRTLSTNPLDKVYALLGISSEKSIVPDYDLLPCDAFREVAQKLLLQSLDTLSLVGNPAWNTIDGLPSWTPDWSSYLREYPYVYYRISQSFQACGNTSPVVKFSDDGKTFFVQGIILDRVNKPGELFDNHVAWNDVYLKEGWKDFLEARKFRYWERRVLRLKRYPTGEDIETVLHKLFIANANIFPSSMAGADLADTYAAFRRYYASLSEVKNTSGPASRETDSVIAYQYKLAFDLAAQGRRIFTTSRGYVGLGPPSMRPDDCIVVLSGGKTAYILRKMKKASTFTFCGEAYVYGFMNGEGFQGDCKLEEFAIV